MERTIEPEVAMARHRVLLVGSEPTTVRADADRLAREGYCVEVVGSGVAALAALDRVRPGIVVLHGRLPDGTAVEVFERLRAAGDVPVVLSDPMGEALDRVLALDAGIDDVVPRPGSPAELVARVRAVLRRRLAGAGTGAEPDVVRAGAVVVDTRSQRAWCHGRAVVLTALEHRLLAHFVRNAGAALSREQLLADVWGYTVGDGSTVTVHVRRLREKIEPDPAAPTVIRTVWGIGYRFEG